jgi:glycosyltransferase involved in cell wall biosynthesis
MGLPVVASDAGGPAEIIRSGVDGLLVAPGDVDALVDALCALAADSALRRRLGASAKTRASDFRADVIAPRFVDVYESLVATR